MEYSRFNDALILIRKIESRNIFTNNDLARLKRNLELKVDLKSYDSNFRTNSTEDYVLKILAFYKLKEYGRAIELSKSSLESNSVSDSLIKVYELIAENTPLSYQTIHKSLVKKSANNIRFNEAMNLLDLMKRKEKILF